MTINRVFALRAISVIAIVYVAACASEINRFPTQFTPSTKHGGPFLVIESETDITPSTGYTRTLKAGSKWKRVGRIPEGEVYQIEDDVFMLEGKHMHEAYCVISQNQLVGFFLPVETAFVPVSPPVSLPVKRN
jgi:hypothetical protein